MQAPAWMDRTRLTPSESAGERYETDEESTGLILAHNQVKLPGPDTSKADPSVPAQYSAVPVLSRLSSEDRPDREDATRVGISASSQDDSPGGSWGGWSASR